jgi:single-stranded DNA-specific DHH superfamily exonuclease
MGHDNAHGVVVEEDKIADLIDYANDRLKNNESTTAYKVDFIWAANDFDELSAEDILKIANYDYLWGQGIHEPYVVIERIPLTADSITLMSPDKNPTLKIAVNSTVNAIKFKSSKEEYDDLIDKGGYMTIVATANKNEWLGKVSPQLFIQNYTLYPKEPKVLFDF